jgi:hypothetical protein
MSGYFGIYRGSVTNNVDPESRYRLKVKVPAVFGVDQETDWALPCFPPGWDEGLIANHTNHSFTDNDTGEGSGGSASEVLTHSVHALKFQVPKINAPVWVMFEAGDERYPVWVGTWRKTGG